MSLLTVCGAAFRMGDDRSAAARAMPAHAVELSSYAIGDGCVTAGEYFEFVKSAHAFDETWCDYIDPCCIVRVGTGFELRDGCAELPMIQVNHAGSAAYCNWLSRNEGLDEVYDLGTSASDTSRTGYRLPTEAEWEHACQLSYPDEELLPPNNTTSFNYADADGTAMAGRASRGRAGGFAFPDLSPVAVRSLPPSPLGTFEMLGNVREWCHEFFAPYTAEPQRDPVGPTRGVYRVVRGGSFLDGPEVLRPYARTAVHGDNKCMQYGFRIARSL